MQSNEFCPFAKLARNASAHHFPKNQTNNLAWNARKAQPARLFASIPTELQRSLNFLLPANARNLYTFKAVPNDGSSSKG
jgi:hypothetical protein